MALALNHADPHKWIRYRWPVVDALIAQCFRASGASMIPAGVRAPNCPPLDPGSAGHRRLTWWFRNSFILATASPRVARDALPHPWTHTANPCVKQFSPLRGHGSAPAESALSRFICLFKHTGFKEPIEKGCTSSSCAKCQLYPRGWSYELSVLSRTDSP